MELLGQYLNQRAEIHAVVGRIVEDGLGVVALVLHIVHLHFQIQVLRYATGLEQCLVLILQAHHPAFQIRAFGAAEQLADILVGGVHAAFLHLDAAHLARQTHNAYVVSGSSLHGHHIAFGHIQTVRQAEKVLAVVLETHLHAVERPQAGLADAAHPVTRSHLAATAGLGLTHGHIRLGAALAPARKEHTLVILHPRQCRVGFKIRVYRILRCQMFTEDVHLVIRRTVSGAHTPRSGVSFFACSSAAAVPDERLHLLGGGGIVVHLLHLG